MYSFSYLEPVCCSMSSSNCCFLTCIEVSQEAGQVVWYSHLFQNFPQFIVIHTVKGFGIINKAETDVFLELSCFFDEPVDVGNSIILDIHIKVCQNLPWFPTLNPHFIVYLWIIFKLSRKCLLSGQPQKWLYFKMCSQCGKVKISKTKN